MKSITKKKFRWRNNNTTLLLHQWRKNSPHPIALVLPRQQQAPTEAFPVAVVTNRQPTLFQLSAEAGSDEDNNFSSSVLQGIKTNLNKRRFERVEVLSLDDDSSDDESSDDDLLPAAC